MHTEVRDYFKKVRKEHPRYFFLKKVLEAGSLYINGTIRDYFLFNKLYLGLDIGEGKGVDIVCHVERFKAYRSFDVVVSTEMLEHCREWDKALHGMYNMLKPGGLLIITCAGPARPIHGHIDSNDPESSPYTNYYYRNISREDFRSILPASLFKTYSLTYGRNEQDLYFHGIKL